MTATPGGRPTGCTAQELLCRAERAVFRLNGQLLAVTDALAGPVGLTTAWWRLLAAVLPRPLTVAEAARTAGIVAGQTWRRSRKARGRGAIAWPLAAVFAALSFRTVRELRAPF